MRLGPGRERPRNIVVAHLARFGLPEPERQFEVRIGEALFWLDVADLKIFIEGDGFGVHSTRNAFERDRDRQNLLVLDGWLPLRFTWRHLCRSPQRVGSQVFKAREKRLRSLW